MSDSLSASKGDTLLTTLLPQAMPEYAALWQNPNQHKIQILYTQINRDTNNNPSFVTHSFNVDHNDYFYPASTVKFPAAVAALEKLNNLNIDGVTRETPLFIDPFKTEDSGVTGDPSATTGKPSIGHYIKKILLASDNDAFNRLFEFLGQQQFNQQLHSKGLLHTTMIRRLESGMSAEDNRTTNGFTFYRDNTILYRQPQVTNTEALSLNLKNVKQGIGHIKDDVLVNEPIDFSHSNYFALSDQHFFLRQVYFPETLPAQQRFNLTDEDYQFIYRYSSMLPQESDIAMYRNPEEYYDSFVKFLMYGDSKASIPKHIRIFNKIGMAYGYLIDNAYIVDFEQGIEFMVSAVIQVNDNQIYNDGVYEYDSVGLPFLAKLGTVLYQYEQQRPKENAPDLSKFDVHPR